MVFEAYRSASSVFPPRSQHSCFAALAKNSRLWTVFTALRAAASRHCDCHVASLLAMTEAKYRYAWLTGGRGRPPLPRSIKSKYRHCRLASRGSLPSQTCLRRLAVRSRLGLDYARDDGAMYRSARLGGGTRASRPTEAENNIPNEYLLAALYLRADEDRPYLFYQM